MNNKITLFDAQQIQTLRQKAYSSWRDQLSKNQEDNEDRGTISPELQDFVEDKEDNEDGGISSFELQDFVNDMKGNEGWSISPLDLQAFVSVFAPSLQLKSGLILRAYQCCSGIDLDTIVWALPENLPFPEPYSYNDKPPQPANALNNIMEAIEGDFSPLSYLYASLFAREISEFGTDSHGSYWISFQIFDQDPWTAPNLVNELTDSIGEWEWFEEKPSDWKPFVSIGNKEIIVQFYTYSGLDYQRITRHIDIYKPNSYVFESSTKEIACNSSGGYFW